MKKQFEGYCNYACMLVTGHSLSAETVIRISFLCTISICLTVVVSRVFQAIPRQISVLKGNYQKRDNYNNQELSY